MMVEHFKLMQSFSGYDRSPSDIFDGVSLPELVQWAQERPLILLLRGEKHTGIKGIQDFYFNDGEVDIDYLFLGKLILRKLFSIFVN